MMFRVLGVPIEVEKTCIVASSFHIKPLLRWMQIDRDFLVLGLEKNSATLYQGNQQTFRFAETIIFPKFPKFWKCRGADDSIELHSATRLKWEETTEWLAMWIANLHLDSKAQLFVAGEKRLSESLMTALKRERLPAKALNIPFDQHSAPAVCAEIRSALRKKSASYLEKSLVEFYLAEERNLAEKNIFQIAKAAVQGRVRKLFIADDFNIFGKMDPKTGALVIHSADLDHEDDCLLDDLAQTVLAEGGEVVVAKREEIPKGHPILAILDRSGVDAVSDLSAKTSTVLFSERRCI